MFRKSGFMFVLVAVCVVTAAVMTAFLDYVGKTARLRVEAQYTSPDYVRYISQGYAFDTVSTKKNYLITVTDGELPVRIHIFTVDADKDTLDILEIPPESYVIADGFYGTLREAFKTPVYKEIMSLVLCLKIDGAASFSAETFGDCVQTLGTGIMSGDAKKSALCFGAYSAGDEAAVKEYRVVLSSALSALCDRGALESFTLLMNFIANRVETDMSLEDIVSAANLAKGVKPKKINIHIATGGPSVFGDERIWSLDPDGVAELLNEHFRVKGIEYQAESLSIPAVFMGRHLYGDLPTKITEILK